MQIIVDIIYHLLISQLNIQCPNKLNLPGKIKDTVDKISALSSG